MPRSPGRWSRALRVPLLFTLACMAVLVACSDDSGDGPPDPTVVEYQGVFGSATTAGRLAFATASADLRLPAARAQAGIPLSGTMDFIDGASVALTGTLDGNNLSLTGGGYTFTGTQANGVINGTFTGPQSGSFTATLVPDGGVVYQLCGEYDGDDSGVFSLTIDANRAGGVIIVPGDGSAGQTGKARPKAGTANDIEVLPDAAPTFVVATGTLNEARNQVSGTWDDGENSGTFTGSVDACIAH